MICNLARRLGLAYIVTHLQDFDFRKKIELLQKKCEFHKSEGTGHAATRNDAVPEAAQIDTSSRILIFEKN